MEQYLVKQLQNLGVDSSRKLACLLMEELRHPAVLYDVIGEGAGFRFCYVNQPMLVHENIKLENILGEPVTEILPTGSQTTLWDAMVLAWQLQAIKKMSMKIYRDDRIVGSRLITIYPLGEVQKLLVISEEHNYLDKLINSFYGFIGVFLTDGTLLECNNAPLLLLGLKKEDVIGLPFWDTPWWTHSSEEQQKIRLAMESAASGIPVRDTLTSIVGDGSTISVDFSFEPLYNDNNEIECLIGFGVDITEQKKLQEELLFKDQFLREAGHAGKLDMWELDFSSEMIVFHSESSFFRALDIENIDDFSQMLHKDDKERVLKEIRDVREGRNSKYQHLYRIHFRDGSLHYVSSRAQVINDDKGNPKKLVGVSIDITDETALASRSQHLLEVVPEGFILCWEDATIELVNDSFCTLSGLSRDDLLGLKLCNVLPEAGERIKAVERTDGKDKGSDSSFFDLLTGNGTIEKVSVDFNYISLHDIKSVAVTIRPVALISAKYSALLKSQKELLVLIIHLHKNIEDNRRLIAREIHDQLG